MATDLTPQLNIPVEFAGVSIGSQTASIGVKIDRNHLTLDRGDAVFCGHRLSGSIVLGRADEDPDQTHMFDDDEILDAVFDCKRMGFDPSYFTIRLTFNLEDIDVAELAKFSNRAGRVIVDDVKEIPQEAKDDSEPEHVPGTLKVEDAEWAAVSLESLFGGAILKALKNQRLETVGDLHNFNSGENRLTDIKGIGVEKATAIEDTLANFFADNPQFAEAAS